MKLKFAPCNSFMHEHEKTKEYKDVVNKLLDSKLDFSDLERAVAEGMQAKLFYDFFKQYEDAEWIRGRRYPLNIVGWLKGENAKFKIKGNNLFGEGFPPGHDHTECYEIFRNGKKERILITQPYSWGLVVNEDGFAQELIEWCTKNDLSLKITTNSWHFYGSTVLVVIKKNEKDIQDYELEEAA